jgi:hypothetical protein
MRIFFSTSSAKFGGSYEKEVLFLQSRGCYLYFKSGSGFGTSLDSHIVGGRGESSKLLQM